jgi:hypothetical protein
MFPIFRHPFTCILSGATGCGKTQWIKKYLNQRRELITPKVEHVLYCYGELNNTLLSIDAEDENVEIHNGMPSEEMIKSQCHNFNNLLVIIDDLMCNLSGNFLDILFTRGSHNWGVSVILVSQHLFTKELRIPRNNSHYIGLMRNKMGESQVRCLASQLFPDENYAYFKETYKDVMKKKFNYLIIVLHPEIPDELQLITNIFGEEGEFPIVYIPNSSTTKRQIINIDIDHQDEEK